jgi:hypothetical protein
MDNLRNEKMQMDNLRNEKMQSHNTEVLKKNRTLMDAYERLLNKCLQLSEVSELTKRLNKKLNRTDEIPSCETDEQVKETHHERNIVELFDSISDKMEMEIELIGSNTQRSMGMID